MNITNGNIDRLHCMAIRHEYLRCRDAFESFREVAEGIILQGHTREHSYRAYNSYSNFILHLFEFLIALHARDFGVTEIKVKSGEKKSDLLDKLVSSTILKVVQNRICAIEEGRASPWENHISVYQKLLPIPIDFASNFRQMRNKLGGHVTYQRIQDINLTEFYEKNHLYLYLLYRDCGDWWAGRSEHEFPQLEQVTDFLMTISRKLPEQLGQI